MRAQTNAFYGVTFQLRNRSDGSPYDLTAKPLRMQIKALRGASAPLTFATADNSLQPLGDPTDGNLYLQAPKSVMASVAPGNYSFDVLCIADPANPTFLFGGTWTVNPGVTDDPSVYLPFRGSDTASNASGAISVVIDDSSTILVSVSEMQALGNVRPLAEIASSYDANSAFSWLSDPNAVLVEVYFGQSLGDFYTTAGQIQNAITTAPIYPLYVWAPTTAEQGDGIPARVPQGETITGFTPLYEFNTTHGGYLLAESSLSGHANTLVKMLHDALGRWVTVVAFSAAVGGLSYMQLKAGSDPFEKFMKNAAEICTLLRAMGKRPIFHHVMWLQGEDDTNFVNSVSKYARDMHQLHRDLDGKLRALSGQTETVQLVIGQDPGAFFTIDPTVLALSFDDLDIPPFAQDRAAQTNPNIIMAGPMYDCDVTPVYHNPHFSERGYLKNGTRLGRIAANMCFGPSFGGLRWNEAKTEWLSATILQLQYDVPLVRGDGSRAPDYIPGALLIDTSGSVVSTAGLYDSTNFGCGFSLLDRQGARVEVNKIITAPEVFYPGGNITKKNVRIHFARPQATQAFITYGLKQTPLMGVYGFPTINAAGSGGTDGTYDLIFTGGSPLYPATGTFTVSGGHVTVVTITDSGFGFQSTPAADTSNCPGLSGASIGLQLVIISCSGPYYGPRGLLRTTDNTLTTVAGDIASQDWAIMQAQALPPAPTPRANLLRNARGKINQRAPGTAANTAKIQDGWYALVYNGKSLAPSTYTDPDIGPVLRMTNSSIQAIRCGAAQIIPSDKSIPLRGQNVVLSLRLRRTETSAAFRSRFCLIASSDTADAPIADFVNDWTSTNLTNGGFFTSNAAYTILGNQIVDSQNTLTDSSEIVFTVPANCNNLIWFVLAYAPLAAGASLDWAPAVELGMTQTGLEDLEPSIELDRARRFYGSDQIGTKTGLTQWVPWPRKLYAVPTVTVTGSASVSGATVDGCFVTGGANETVTRTWDTGL